MKMLLVHGGTINQDVVSVSNSILKAPSKSRIVLLSLLFMLLITMSAAVQSVITSYTDEATYLADLSFYVQLSESFEGTAWNSVRSAVLNTQALPSITNLGLTWQNRFNPVGGVTTSDGGGNVHHGSWQFYASPHGGYAISGLDCTIPGECSDGFTVTSDGAGLLYGVGGWFTGAGGPEIKFLLDDVEVIDAGGTGINIWQFFAVIDTNGFSKAEIRDSSGTIDDQNFFWADDFTFAVTTLPPSAGSLEFSTTGYSVNENGVSAIITVTRIGGSVGAASVDYASIAGGSATPGSDYNATSGTINFANGDVARTFTVPIIDDSNYEGDETVNLLLSNATAASLGTPSSAVLTITENELVPPSGSLQFSAVSYSVAENRATATITVTRVGGSSGTVGVDYASADGSAMAGSDYTAVSNSLSFAEGVVSQTFSVDINDDADYEGDETLSLTLSNPTGGAGLGPPALVILIISENDPVPPSGRLQFSAASYSVAENGTTATITVTRVGGGFGTVGVDYASADGSATAGSDYTAVSSSLSFADGVVSQIFSVDINDDADYEGDESLNLVLSNPTGGAGLSTPGTASLLVIENEIFSDTASEAVDINVSTGGSSSIDVITLILFISLALYRRNLSIKRDGLYHPKKIS